MKKLLFILIVCCSLNGFGQNQGNMWLFGQGGGLDFNGVSPVSITGSQIFGNPTQLGDYLYSEGCASISDNQGSLLFYSNGEKVWNRNHTVMPNGNNLMGFYSSSSSAFIIPVPLSDSLFYLFTTDGIERYLQNGLRYSLVDMCLDSGNGDVVSSQKNILLLDTVSEKLCSVVHPNGIDYWLISHKHFTNSFYAYRITPSGINSPIVSNIGSVHTGGQNSGSFSAIGQMKASPDGSRIGLTFSNVTPSVVEVFDFDATTGVVSNHLSLTPSSNTYGVEFSPDNSKFYLTSLNGVWQFDLTAGGGNQTAINASKTQISTGSVCSIMPIQLGPDGKIYLASCGSNALSVINSPNNVGALCGYVNGAVNISPCVNNSSLPSFIAGYNYNNNLSSCIPTDVIEQKEPNQIALLPNPVNQFLSMENLPFNSNIRIYNSIGELLYSEDNVAEPSKRINVSKYLKGLMLIRIESDGEINFYKIIKN